MKLSALIERTAEYDNQDDIDDDVNSSSKQAWLDEVVPLSTLSGHPMELIVSHETFVDSVQFHSDRDSQTDDRLISGSARFFRDFDDLVSNEGEDNVGINKSDLEKISILDRDLKEMISSDVPLKSFSRALTSYVSALRDSLITFEEFISDYDYDDEKLHADDINAYHGVNDRDFI